MSARNSGPPRFDGVLRRWGHALPLVVLATVLLFSVLAALLVARLTQQQQQARFEREIAAHTGALRGRLDDFSKLVVASRAFWLSQPQRPSAQSFSTFTQQLRLADAYPDVQAIGFVEWRQGPPPQASITAIAPPSPVNRRALGTDMMAEPERRSTIERAIRQDEVQMTSLVQLFQRDAYQKVQPGFLLLAPVWRGEGEQRILEGLVYVAVRANSFAESLSDSFGRDVLPSRITLDGHLVGVPSLSAGGYAQPVRTLLGQDWQVTYAPPTTFDNDPLEWLAPFMVILGLFAAGTSFTLIRRQVLALEAAEGAYVHLSVVEQRQQQARAEFEAIFQAMQDAAAFTDEHGRVRLVNRAMTEQFRLPLTEMVGRSLTLLHLDRRLDDRSTFQAVTTPYQRGDGSEFFGEAQRNEVNDASGERMGWLEVIRDVSERVRADQALRSEERRSRAILDSFPHMLWVSDTWGKQKEVNTQFRQWLGDAVAEERVYSADLAAFQTMWHRAHASADSTSCTVRIYVNVEAAASEADPRRTLELEPRWFEVWVAPLLDEQGQAFEWVATATDVHDRIMAERSAQNSEARYRGVVDSMPQIVWLASASGRVTYFNRRWQEFVGADAGEDILAKIHPDDRADYAQRWDAAVKQGQPFEAEHRLWRQGGGYRTFVTQAVPIQTPNGEVLEWVGTMTDIDDSVYAENAARLFADVTEAMVGRSASPAERPERYDTLMSLVTGRVMDAAGLWLYDPAAQGDDELKLLASRINSPHWNLPHIVQLTRQLALKVAHSGEPEYLTTHPLLHAVQVSGGVLYPLTGAEGVRGVLGLAHRHPLEDRDHELILELAARLTTALETDELRERAAAAREELEQLNQSLEERVARRTTELEEANRELEAFSYSVSHDLRTPLRHIVGFGDLLRKDAADTLSPKSQRYIGVITDAAGRMSGLIDSLLEFSRMGRQPLRLVPIELGTLAEKVWQMLEPDRTGRKVDFRLGELPTVAGDPALLELVFQNLLSNALKYSRTREVSVIEVFGVMEGSYIRISVRDNGVGFDPKYTAKLFGVFQRLHTAEEFDGIGIGLANVRRIIARHGGQVSAESVQGEGATFSVTLPLSQEGRAQPEIESREPEVGA